MKRFILFLSIFLLSISAYADIVPRTLIALYDGQPLEKQSLHTAAEMPLNYLGLTLEYHDVRKPLPDLTHREDVLGVISWFDGGEKIAHTEGYTKWLMKEMDAGKKLVILGNPGFIEDTSPEGLERTNEVLGRLGLYYTNQWQDMTYQNVVIKDDKSIMNYERKLPLIIPDHFQIKSFDPENRIILSIADYGNKDLRSDLIVTGPHGGYAQDGFFFYELFNQKTHEDEKAWIMNPFVFFRKALETDVVPKADTTTLAGSRIFYSHIDGDGWNNISDVRGKNNKLELSVKVLSDHVFKKYPYFPVTVSAIAGDLDPDWVGTEASRNAAREVYALKNIRVGSHTYSHPFEWQFFDDYSLEKEFPLLSRYPGKTWGSNKKLVASLSEKVRDAPPPKLDEKYEVPRAYAKEPFDLHKELVGSLSYIDKYAPKGKKKGDIILWSGNTTPSAPALKMLEENNLLNINGGDTRFDNKYPSVSWVAPIGKQLGKYHQIYSSNSNENTYTNLWHSDFFGYSFLTKTFESTENPIRLKPMNMYYHMYSGEKEASLKAVLHNMGLLQSDSFIA